MTKGNSSHISHPHDYLHLLMYREIFGLVGSISLEPMASLYWTWGLSCRLSSRTASQQFPECKDADCGLIGADVRNCENHPLARVLVVIRIRHD